MTDQAAGTATEQVAPGTDVEHIPSGILAQVSDPAKSFDLKKIIAGLAEDVTPLPASTEAPKAPPAPNLSPAVLDALKTIAKVYGKVAPSEPRKLEKVEVEDLTYENWVIAQITTVLGQREKQIDRAMRNHFDAVARERGITGPLIAGGVAEGHILAAKPGIPFKVQVDGYEDPWQQQFTTGASDLKLDLLEEKLAAGEITRKEYLAFTTESRVLSETGIRVFLRKNPVRGLKIMRMVTVRKPNGASLVSPKKKQ